MTDEEFDNLLNAALKDVVEHAKWAKQYRIRRKR